MLSIDRIAAGTKSTIRKEAKIPPEQKYCNTGKSYKQKHQDESKEKSEENMSGTTGTSKLTPATTSTSTTALFKPTEPVFGSIIEIYKDSWVPWTDKDLLSN